MTTRRAALAVVITTSLCVLPLTAATIAHASVPPPDGKPHWPAYRVAGARNASALSTGATAWVAWSWRKAKGYKLLDVGGSCVRSAGIEHWLCAVHYEVISPHGVSRYGVTERFHDCDARSTVRHHAWKLDESAWIDRPTILVHRPPAGQPWSPARDGGVVCAGHDVRGNDRARR